MYETNDRCTYVCPNNRQSNRSDTALSGPIIEVTTYAYERPAHVIDCVRARNTSLHDYDRETMPFLETFAEDATVYKQARAPGDV